MQPYFHQMKVVRQRRETPAPSDMFRHRTRQLSATGDSIASRNPHNAAFIRCNNCVKAQLSGCQALSTHRPLTRVTVASATCQAGASP